MTWSTSEALALLQVGPGLDYQLDQLPPLLSRMIPDLDVEVVPPLLDIEEAKDTGRGQYHSTRIMAILENHGSLAEFEKLLGVTSVDLFNPSPKAAGSGFVFGEARVRGRSGIVSTFRLRADPSSSSILNDRVKKEVFHELGHVLGLEHCSSTNCVMHRSEDVGDTDAKSEHYCDNCQAILEEIRR